MQDVLNSDDTSDRTSRQEKCYCLEILLGREKEVYAGRVAAVISKYSNKLIFEGKQENSSKICISLIKSYSCDNVILKIKITMK